MQQALSILGKAQVEVSWNTQGGWMVLYSGGVSVGLSF